MGKIIKIENLNEKKEELKLIESLNSYIYEKKYPTAFFLADANFNKYKTSYTFFVTYLDIVRNVSFFSSVDEIKSIIYEKLGILDNDDCSIDDLPFFDDDDMNFFDEELKNFIEQEGMDNDFFGYDKALKDFSIKLGEENEDFDLANSIKELDFKAIFEKIMDTYNDFSKDSPTVSLYLSEIVLKNIIALNPKAHTDLALLLKHFYSINKSDIRIAYNYIATLINCSLNQTIDTEVLPVMIYDAFKIYEKFKYEGIAEIFSYLLMNYEKSLPPALWEKGYKNLKEIIRENLADDKTTSLTCLEIFITKKVYVSGNRHYKNILTDVKKLAKDTKIESLDVWIIYVNTIVRCIDSGCQSIKLPWLLREVKPILEEFGSENLLNSFCHALACLSNTAENIYERVEILEKLRMLKESNEDNLVISGYYGLGISYFALSNIKLNLDDLKKSIREISPILNIDLEIYAIALAMASQHFQLCDKKAIHQLIKKIVKENPNNDKIAYAEIIAITEILNNVEGDDFYAYFKQLEKNYKKNSGKGKFILEIEYLVALSDLKNRMENSFINSDKR